MKSITIAIAALAALVAASPALAAPDPAKGKQVFAQCAACHKADASGRSSIGPNLWQVVGRKSGTLPGFKYSPAMTKAGTVWTDKSLDVYLAAPLTSMPGNRMPFAGIKASADRQNLIAYLKTLR
ncbi:MAG: cytochrome c family protein [Sphingomonadales bacterium]|nr:cytochrome c family protein [Sphingomonadales bacterium]MBU3993997.1 cytochrome c family protein [Alphaproteobacteria bacterium]